MTGETAVTNRRQENDGVSGRWRRNMARKPKRRVRPARPGKTRYRKYRGEAQARMDIRDPDAWERWDLWRRSGPAVRGETDGPGLAPGCKEGRCSNHPLTLQCRRKGCGALVDWRAAKIAARAAGRKSVAAGAGCANPRHDARRGKARHGERGSRRHRQFVLQQAAMAAQLQQGTRVLVEWFKAVDDVNIWKRPAAAVTAALEIANARE